MTCVRSSSLALLVLLAAAGCAKSRSPETPAAGAVTLAGGAADESDVTVDGRWCTRCHGDASRAPLPTDSAGIAFAPPADASAATTGAKVGAHLAHLRPTTLRSTGIECSSCHVVPATADAHTPGVLLRRLASTRLGGTPAFTPAYDSATGTCSNVYCHGKFNGGNARTVSWNGTSAELGCGTCHGFPPTLRTDGATAHPNNFDCGACHTGYTGGGVNREAHLDGNIDLAGGCTGCHGTSGRADGDLAGATYDPNQEAAPPLDAHGASTGVLVGVHLAHVNPSAATGVYKPILCGECHPDNSTGHPGGGLTVTFATATGADLASYVPSFTQGNGATTATTCSTYCHQGSAAGSVATWAWNGAAAGCGSCHGAPPAFLRNGTTAHPNNTACGGCHGGYTSSSVNLVTHIDGAVQGTGTCTTCHGTDARANGDMALPYDVNQAAAPPLDSNGASTGVLVGVHLAHVNPSVATGVYRPIACTECHPDNAAGGHPGGGLTVTFATATGADLAGFGPTFAQGNGTSTATTCDTYCHGGSPGGSVTTWSWTGASAGCASCHADPPATAGHAGVTSATNCGGCHPGYTATAVNLSTHINGQLDGGESIGALTCGGCHGAIFNAMNGTVAKTSRHALTSDSPTFNTTINWADPLGNNAAAVRSCTNMCHEDHPHTLGGSTTTHEYNVYADANARATASTTTSRSKTDFDGTLTNGGLCVSCHRFAITGGGPTVDKAAYDASAHDYVTGGGSTWEFRLHTTTGANNAFQRNCTKCHASNAEGTTPSITVTSSGANSVHFNTNDSLLAGSTTLTPAVTDLVCYNCHGSAAPVAGVQGNRSGKNIQGQFAKASTHAVAGVTCRSCHDPHRAKAGTHATPGNLAGPPIEGASGAQLTGTVGFFAAPTAGSFTAKPAIAAGTDVEATLCFKCHSAFGTLPAGTTDQAREFNPANVGSFAGSWVANESAGGFHPVLADAGNNLGAVNMANLVTTNFPWRTSGTRNLMTCTDCHESNTTTDPNGPHGSAANFILKGPNTTWNNTMVATSTGMPTGAFCANCHSATWASSRFTGTQHYSRSAHRVPCMNCHAAIPHGGPRPGILVAPAGIATGVPAYTGWDGAAPYATPGTGGRLYIKSYPANAATAWGQSNCGCNGTGH